MKLIIGLGNPEDKYSGTRHNVGFFMLDHLASSYQIDFQPKTKFKAHIAELSKAGEKVFLAKPTTYYNSVGESYRALTDFYDIAPEDVLIIADDLALPIGTLRTRIGGSDAGNNGIKSINAHGGEHTRRLRVGISNDLRIHMSDIDLVLGKFSSKEIDTLEGLLPRVSTIVEDFITSSFDTTTHR
ncbi:MAG TPA: aminoacyl-tRNA hydrolase [Candidatus Saccharimonadales bacterium]